ncbi:hypothetical protein [uncultured Dialister sp.]|jgi:hypothetical protein|uniref:hypothetical protein n=1 Tax=Dialister sp. TaxID=1955814 RepID=UPI0025E55CF4|nr:hypothetical protein [uncultured Dialister sp.]
MNNKLAKILLLILAAAFASRGFKKNKAPKLPKKEADLEPPEILKPLAPITKAYWLFHPKKAFSLYLFQKAAGITWNLARRYFRG